MPASTPAASWSPASEGPIVSTVGWLNFTGSAPYFSELDRDRACDWVKSPVIWALPSRIGVVTCGKDSTLPSSTIAKVRPVPASSLVTSANVLRALLLNARSTAQPTLFCGVP